jgi:hypothetical protein
MRLRQIIDEDFVNYKKPSMLLCSCFCDWKCATEQGLNASLCQNADLINEKIISLSAQEIVERYLDNPIINAIVIAGFEPFLQFDELLKFILVFRHYSQDDIVIYTGYYPKEIKGYVDSIKRFPNIIIKYGRYIPNREKKFDDVLGVYLISDNQFAEKIS